MATSNRMKSGIDLLFTTIALVSLVCIGEGSVVPCHAQTFPQTRTLDAHTNVLELDSSNSFSLAASAGTPNVSLQASGIAHFGFPVTATYGSIVFVGLDTSNGIRYGSIPIGTTQNFSGNHFANAFITDIDPSDNSGSIAVTERDSSNAILASGSIDAVSSVALFTPTNHASFDTPVLGHYSIYLTGSAFYGGSSPYNAAAIEYVDSNGKIQYDALPVGATHTYYGFGFNAFITDTKGTLGDNSGSLTLTMTQVPETSSIVLWITGGLALAFSKLRKKLLSVRVRC